MRGSGAVALLVAGRAFVEAVAFTALAAVAHAAVRARDPLAVPPTALALFGVALLLATVLRETGGERRSATLLVLTLAAGVAWGLSLPMDDPDGLATVSRVVLFGLLAEAYLWRVVSIARGAARWTDARNALVVAACAIALAVIVPGPIDRGPFAVLALLGVAAAGLALSLARSIEELALSRGAGEMRASSATSAMVVLGLFAIVAAALTPDVGRALEALGAWLAPVAERVLYLIILPFAYVASFLVEALLPLLRGARFPQRPDLFRISPEEDAEMVRQIEAARPWVFGAMELVVVAIGVLVALVLLERMVRERRAALAEGVTLEREATGGMSLLDALRALRPAGRTRRRPPRDDGTPESVLRLAYWRFLQLAERRGAGWRAEPETPAEHQTRIASADPAWRAASPIVRAFEDLRYGEARPDPAVVAGVREALRGLEAVPHAARRTARGSGPAGAGSA